jgi:hypothetical protein
MPGDSFSVAIFRLSLLKISLESNSQDLIYLSSNLANDLPSAWQRAGLDK